MFEKIGYVFLSIALLMLPAYNAYLAGKLGKDRLWYYIISFLTFPFISLFITFYLRKEIKIWSVDTEKLKREISIK